MHHLPDYKLDPPEDEEKVYCRCDECEEDIYFGEEIYVIDGFTIHYDCLRDFMNDDLQIAEE